MIGDLDPIFCECEHELDEHHHYISRKYGGLVFGECEIRGCICQKFIKAYIDYE